MRWLIAAFALPLLASGAQAQVSPQQMNANANSLVGQHAAKSANPDDGNAKAKANDKAYNAALHNLPDKHYDPWHGVR
jgi:hypothetical protein